jgi:hypothetical protein
MGEDKGWEGVLALILRYIIQVMKGPFVFITLFVSQSLKRIRLVSD